MSAPLLWPVSLPLKPLTRTITVQEMKGRVSFMPEDPVAIERARHTAAVEKFQFSLPAISSDQVDTFDRFYRADLGHGSVRFGWRHPISGAIRKARIDEPVGKSHLGVDRWKLDLSITIINVTPSWAKHLTTVNGYMQVVDQAAWAAL